MQKFDDSRFGKQNECLDMNMVNEAMPVIDLSKNNITPRASKLESSERDYEIKSKPKQTNNEIEQPVKAVLKSDENEEGSNKILGIRKPYFFIGVGIFVLAGAFLLVKKFVFNKE